MSKKYIQITSGRGPVECCRVVVLVMQKFIAAAKTVDVSTEIVEVEEGPEPGTLFSVTLSVEGERLDDLKKNWQGSICWMSTKNPYRPFHKRKRWFVGVAFIEPIKNDIIKDRDIRYETMRASGPGGQNVNKVETSVRATYVPTGLSVVASDNRSQTLNKKLAYERLLAKLSAIEDEKHSEQERAVWMNHNLLERGNAVQTFKGDL